MSSSVLSGPPYSSEAAALLSIVQGSNETVNTADCGAPEAGDFNWSFFIDLACRNHVALTVYRHRSHRLLHALPADAAGTLRDAYLGMTQHGLRLATIWREVAPALEAEGIRVLAYKGRALAEELYGDASARHTWDVDALVESPECAKRACEVLRLHGYALRLPKTAGTVDDALHHDCELMLDHERGPASLELHWRLLPDAFGAGGSADFMWTGAVRKRWTAWSAG